MAYRNRSGKTMSSMMAEEDRRRVRRTRFMMREGAGIAVGIVVVAPNVATVVAVVVVGKYA